MSKNISVLAMSVHFFFYMTSKALYAVCLVLREMYPQGSQKELSAQVCVCVRKMGLVGLTDDTWMQSFMHGF